MICTYAARSFVWACTQNSVQIAHRAATCATNETVRREDYPKVWIILVSSANQKKNVSKSRLCPEYTACKILHHAKTFTVTCEARSTGNGMCYGQQERRLVSNLSLETGCNLKPVLVTLRRLRSRIQTLEIAFITHDTMTLTLATGDPDKIPARTFDYRLRCNRTAI